MSLLKKIFSISKEIVSFAFEIESVDEDHLTGLLFFLVKIKGKATPLLKKDPIDLIKEARSEKCFSNSDFLWIIDILLENQKRIIEKKHQKKYSFIKHQFSEQLEEALIIYSDLKNKIHIKPAREVFCNIDKIKNFSSEDSACIGNIVGCCETEKEYRCREKYIKNHTPMFDT